MVSYEIWKLSAKMSLLPLKLHVRTQKQYIYMYNYVAVTIHLI